MILPEFHVVYAVNDAITSYWHLLHSSLSDATGPRNSTLWGRGKKCVREMTVEVGFFSGHPGCYLVSLRAFPYNRYDAVCSFLLSMLPAPPIVRLAVGSLKMVL